MKISRALPLLPNEVITEILSWVPVKPLLRFRCVCKFWKSLLSDPAFVKLHLQRSSKNRNFILKLMGGDRYNTVISCSMSSFLQNSYDNAQKDHLFLNCKYRVLGSCNGLVCLYTSSYEGKIGKYWVRFWNPEMRLKSKKSPSLRVYLPRLPSNVSDFQGNRFDSNGSNLQVNSFDDTSFAFVYDPSSDTYKVVAVLDDRHVWDHSKIIQMKVYSMGDHCWRDIQPFPARSVEGRGIYLSGTLNWSAILNSGLTRVIVSLDLGTETYKQFKLPDGHDRYVEIGVLGDCLCVYHGIESAHFCIWQMKEFGVDMSWAQLLRVSYQHLQTQYEQLFCIPLVPLCILENGDVLMLLRITSEIIIYNQRDKTVERDGTRNNRVWAKDHVQSLILPC